MPGRVGDHRLAAPPGAASAELPVALLDTATQRRDTAAKSDALGREHAVQPAEGPAEEECLLHKCLRPAPLAALPQLPWGQRLSLELLSTWGDEHYIGLAAIELWDAAGASLRPTDPTRQLHAEPAGVYALPGLQDDPRTPAKLFDGVLATCDSCHMWLAPFSPGERHLLAVVLDRPASLARLRVWNYNASRAHAQRGARYAPHHPRPTPRQPPLRTASLLPFPPPLSSLPPAPQSL